MKGRTKKQIRRLIAATETYVIYPQSQLCGEIALHISHRKALTGKSARFLIGKCHRRLSDKAGWIFSARPNFRNDRKYIISHMGAYGAPKWLRIIQVEPRVNKNTG